jgi:hypothetical protein
LDGIRTLRARTQTARRTRCNGGRQAASDKAIVTVLVVENQQLDPMLRPDGIPRQDSAVRCCVQ